MNWAEIMEWVDLSSGKSKSPRLCKSCGHLIPASQFKSDVYRCEFCVNKRHIDTRSPIYPYSGHPEYECKICSQPIYTRGSLHFCENCHDSGLVRKNMDWKAHRSGIHFRLGEGCIFDFGFRDFVNMYAYWKGKCPVCEKSADKHHIDHWIPVSYQGEDNPETIAANLVPLCALCNRTKHATMPDVWLRQNYSERQAQEIEHRIKEYFQWVIEIRSFTAIDW